MAWILLLLAIGCFVATFLTKSFAFGVLCLVLALVFVIAATMMLLSARVNDAARNVTILSPEELRTLREQAEAKRDAGGKASGNTGTPAAASTAGAPGASDGHQAPPTSS